MSADPVRSGLIGMMGTFFDTIVVCSMTGLVIVVSGAWQTARPGRNSRKSGSVLRADIGGESWRSRSAYSPDDVLGWAYYGGDAGSSWAAGRHALSHPVDRCDRRSRNPSRRWTIAGTLNALMAINLIALLYCRRRRYN
jgi:AGCS family alanine or glycine:cation symporter